MGCFQLDVNYSEKIVKNRNFETLIILYMYIPPRTTKNFLKNVGYAWEYPGTTVGPPLQAAQMAPYCFLGSLHDKLDTVSLELGDGKRGIEQIK